MNKTKIKNFFEILTYVLQKAITDLLSPWSIVIITILIIPWIIPFLINLIK